MSDAELHAILSGESKHQGMVSLPLQQLISAELLARGLEKIKVLHWSVTPSFWLLLISAVAACIAAYPVLFPPPQAQQSVVVTPSPAPAQAIPPANNKPSNLASPSALPKIAPAGTTKR